jgi:DNA-binding SARP family transcriptional activator
VATEEPVDGVLTRAPLGAAIFREAFERLALAVVVVDGAGAVLAHNEHASKLFGAALGAPVARCCDLIGCGRAPRSLGRGCITAAMLLQGRPVNAVMQLADGRRVDVAAAPLAVGAMLQIRPAAGAAAPSVEAPPPLRVTTLGGLSLECGGASLEGAWVHHRPGQLLRYLICARGDRVPVDELVDAIWPGPRRRGLTSLRQSVHGLRQRLEPDRPSQTPSRFVVASPGAYALDMEHVVVDADEFEAHARAALVAVERGVGRAAEAQLERAAGLYRGEFLADDHYGEWALAERDRLRSLAAQVLRQLADLNQSAGQLPATARALERLVELEPLDLANQRDLISFLVRTGQHASAARRYENLRWKFKRAFGAEPGFALPDLVPRGGTPS